jgi:hypothetical protein
VSYPFPIPPALVDRLPPPTGAGGLRLVDVHFRGRWDGVLAVDSSAQCVGVYVQRRVDSTCLLPFTSDEIDDVRAASVWNRAIASYPFDLWITATFAILVIAPSLLFATRFVGWRAALGAIVVSTFSVRTLYEYSGFIFMRLPLAMTGLAWIIVGGMRLWSALRP